MNDSKKDRLIWTIVITVGFFMLVGIMSVAYESEHGVNSSELSKKSNLSKIQKVSQSQRNIELKVPDNWGLEDIQKGKSAVALFVSAHGVLFNNYLEDIDSIQISKIVTDKIWLENDYRYVQYGWERYYLIRVFINKNPRTIPATCNIAGNTLFYALGKGTVTGYEIIKGLNPVSPCLLHSSTHILIPSSEIEAIEFSAEDVTSSANL